MKIYICLVIVSLFVPLCTADMFSPAITTGIDYALFAASIADSNYTGPAVIALSECDCPGIIFSGAPSIEALTILNSGIHINSNATEALSVDGYSNISANYVNVVGGIDDRFFSPKNDLTGVYIHDFTDEIIPIPDPYAWPDGEHPLPDHDLTAIKALPDLGTISTAGTYAPGYYSGGIQITEPNLITLQPGNYYLDSVGQSASITLNRGLVGGEGVTLHIIGDADYGIYINGGTLDITAPTSGTYAGIGIYQKRNPNYDCIQSCTEPWSAAFPMSEFNGYGSIYVGGVVYMPHNRLELNGTATIILDRIIADRLYVCGTGQKVIGYDGHTYIPGDLTKNGSVNIDDLIWFCTQWGLENPLSDMYIKSNLNYDMNLDLQDFAIFANYWLEGEMVIVP